MTSNWRRKTQPQKPYPNPWEISQPTPKTWQPITRCILCCRKVTHWPPKARRPTKHGFLHVRWNTRRHLRRLKSLPHESLRRWQNRITKITVFRRRHRVRKATNQYFIIEHILISNCVDKIIRFLDRDWKTATQEIRLDFSGQGLSENQLGVLKDLVRVLKSRG